MGTTPTPLSQATTGLLSGAQGLLSTGTAQEQQAYNEAQAAQNALTQSRQNEAGTLANMQGNPIPIEFQQGRGNIVQGLYQTQQANLGSQVQGESALAGTGAGLAQTGQSGLASAGQLGSQTVTAPAGGVTTNQVTGQQYSNPIYEPATGAYSALSPQPNGTAGQPSTAGQPTQYTIKQGDDFYALAQKNGTTLAAVEAANPGVDPNNLQAGQVVNIPTTQGTNSPFSGGVAAGQAQQGQQTVQNDSAIASAKGLQTQLQNDINVNGINSLSSVNLANSFNQWINGNLSNQGQGQFFQDLTDYTMTLAPLIGINGTQTDAKNYIANSMIPATNSGQTILGLAQNLMNNAIIKNNAIKGVGQGNVPSSNSQTQSTTPYSTPSKLGGSYSIVNGKVTYYK